MPWILHVFLKQGIIGEKTAKRTASFREKRVLQSENLRRAGKTPRPLQCICLQRGFDVIDWLQNKRLKMKIITLINSLAIKLLLFIDLRYPNGRDELSRPPS